MNAGFRNLLGWRDTTRFKAFFLAIAVQMLILPVFIISGLIHPVIPAFFPLGATIGGFLFGLAMDWGGGCAAGVWYKMGAGSIGAFVSIVGLVVGYIAAEDGFLKTIRVLIQSVGTNDRVRTMTLPGLFNLPLWWLSIPLAAMLLVFLFRNPRADDSGDWKKTGLIVGAVGVAAWLSSSLSGRPFGMAVMPGSKDALDVLTNARQSGLSWDFFFVMGIPLGGYLSASRKGEFSWSNISGVSIWKMLGGGLVLGVSASIAGGCTVGHGLTGVPLLSVGSIVFVVFAMLGAWTGVAVYRSKLVIAS